MNLKYLSAISSFQIVADVLDITVSSASEDAAERQRNGKSFDDVNGKDVFNKNLYLGTLDGNSVYVRNILALERANPNGQNKNGFTPLHAASFKGWTNLVELLVLFGAEVNENSHKDETPLHFASLTGA